ncbi:MAG: SIR2 family protein [Bacteroidetes bacterium]|nr:SIR2 family protein [Bacteroidota bacterium]
MRYFNNDYSKNLRLYKLHGSIDNFILLKATSPGATQYSRDNSVRVKRDFAVGEFLMERLDETLQKYVYDRPFSENYPDFLTGTTEKIRLYNDPFYDKLFSIFKSNLLHSNQLFVIGYGFQDKGINEFLENHYLIFNKPMIVIDIKKPDSPLIEKYNDQITFIDKGAIGVSYKEYMELVKLPLKS